MFVQAMDPLFFCSFFPPFRISCFCDYLHETWFLFEFPVVVLTWIYWVFFFFSSVILHPVNSFFCLDLWSCIPWTVSSVWIHLCFIKLFLSDWFGWWCLVDWISHFIVNRLRIYKIYWWTFGRSYLCCLFRAFWCGCSSTLPHTHILVFHLLCQLTLLVYALWLLGWKLVTDVIW